MKKSRKLCAPLDTKCLIDLREYNCGMQKPGHYKIYWDGNDNHGQFVGTGICFCHLNTEIWKKTIKVVLIKK